MRLDPIIGGANWCLDYPRELLDSIPSVAVEAFAGVSNVAVVSDGSIDVALVNGIFNLSAARAAISRELTRVVRPGGEGGAFLEEFAVAGFRGAVILWMSPWLPSGRIARELIGSALRHKGRGSGEAPWKIR